MDLLKKFQTLPEAQDLLSESTPAQKQRLLALKAARDAEKEAREALQKLKQASDQFESVRNLLTASSQSLSSDDTMSNEEINALTKYASSYHECALDIQGFVGRMERSLVEPPTMSEVEASAALVLEGQRMGGVVKDGVVSEFGELGKDINAVQRRAKRVLACYDPRQGTTKQFLGCFARASRSQLAALVFIRSAARSRRISRTRHKA
tara:strand:- start:4061 stop:4684 length:624 start_codon:yes stop_codon:yes gene_type:complete